MMPCEHPARAPLTGYASGCRCGRCRHASLSYQRWYNGDGMGPWLSLTTPPRRWGRKLDTRPHGPRRSDYIVASGHIYWKWPTHPLAFGNRVLAHRAVLWDVYGGRLPTACPRCGTPFHRWSQVMAVLLDGDPANIHQSNVAAACRACHEDYRRRMLRTG